jgi:hypothetical protein
VLGLADEVRTKFVPLTSAALLTVWLKVVDDWPNAIVAIKSTIKLAIAPTNLEFFINTFLGRGHRAVFSSSG